MFHNGCCHVVQQTLNYLLSSISEFTTEIEHWITSDQLRAATRRLVINEISFQDYLIPHGLASAQWTWGTNKEIEKLGKCHFRC